MLDNKNQEHIHKVLTKILAIWLIVFLVFGGLLMSTSRASAFDFNQAIQNIFDFPYRTLQKVWQFSKDRLKSLAAVAYKNAIKRFMTSLAKRGAEELAGGITGQKPAFETNVGQFVQESADGALGDFLNNSVGKMWGKDLCQPLNPLVKVNVELTGRNVLDPGKPSCKFTTVLKRAGDLKKLTLDELVDFSGYFNPSGNDIGAVLTITSGALQEKTAAKESSTLSRIIWGEWQPKTGIIENDVVRTPAGIYGAYYAGLLDKSLVPYGVYTGDAIADAVDVFANTLTNKLLEHYTKGLFNPKSKTGSVGTGGSYAPAISSSQLSSAKFSDLGVPDYNFSGAEVSILDNLSCGTQNQYSCTIDEPFKEAIAQKLTVAQAIQQNLVHSSWAFGYDKDKNGGTDGPTKSIYSYRTLVILRKYRIIPVTWELAAEYYYKFDQSGKPLTLDLLTSDAYYNNPDSPYYRLVDKGWVLKAPETICQREGAGEEVLETFDASVDANGNQIIDDNEKKILPTRNNYCADERSCVKESKGGNSCELYGYCTKEKQVWDIASPNGACEEYYNSCQTYVKRDGTTVSYLRNTLSGLNGECSETTSVGCKEYCTSFDPKNNNWTCSLDQTGTRIYLNRKAEEMECEDKEAGCSGFVRMSANLKESSNWIPNSSFNYFKTTDRVNFSPANNDSQFVKFNGSGIIENGGLKLASDLKISVDTQRSLSGRTFVFSLNSKNKDLDVKLLTAGGEVNKIGETSIGDYYRLAWQYRFDMSLTDNKMEINIPSATSTIDDLQLVEAESDKDYREYGRVNMVNLKKSPVNYECDKYTKIVEGKNETNCNTNGQMWRKDIQKCVEGGMEACKDYAMYCSEGDVGCQSYTPVSYSGSVQPGVIGKEDLCPEECVGYKSYLEQPSFFETQVPASRNPVYMIATSARVCSASDNGCEEFTNLSQGAGGEEKEYYSFMRACVLPDSADSDINDFYSWVSGDESGNQLRKWTLLKSNLGEYPCTNPVTAADGKVTCGDTAATEQLCKLGDTNPNNNPAINPDCVEFTNTGGTTKWVKFSRVVFASEECTKYRRTNIAAGETEQRIYSAIPSLSQTCSAASFGCREYKGSASNNIKEILRSDFDDGTSQNWVSGTGGGISSESIVANGRSLFSGIYNGKATIGRKDFKDLVHMGASYKLSFWARSKSSDSNILTASFSGDKVFTGQISLKSEWGKYTINLINFDREPKADEALRMDATSEFYIDNIVLTETSGDLYLIKDSWQTPASCDMPTKGVMLGCESYKDKNNKEWYAKSFSKVCYDFAVGCEQMIDTFNTTAPFEEEYGKTNTTFDDVRDNVVVSQDKLIYIVYDEAKRCDVLGCTHLAMMDLTPENKINFIEKYIVVNPKDFQGQGSMLCLSKAVGCDEFQPTGESVAGRVYFKDPGTFVCEYRGVNGSYNWYKVGSNALCPGSAGNNSGYCANNPETGCDIDNDCVGNAPCIIEKHCIGGRSVNNNNSLSNICKQDMGSDGCINYATGKLNGLCSTWTAICPEDRNTCTEYQDPNNPEDCNRDSVNYEYTLTTDAIGKTVKSPPCDFYYYKADQVEKCTSVDPAVGCLGFHQTDGGSDIWYSVPRCEGNPELHCESDSDCISGGKNWGKCTYITDTKI